jgi:hypothetical protein
MAVSQRSLRKSYKSVNWNLKMNNKEKLQELSAEDRGPGNARVRG